MIVTFVFFLLLINNTYGLMMQSANAFDNLYFIAKALRVFLRMKLIVDKYN